MTRIKQVAQLLRVRRDKLKRLGSSGLCNWQWTADVANYHGYYMLTHTALLLCRGLMREISDIYAYYKRTTIKVANFWNNQRSFVLENFKRILRFPNTAVYIRTNILSFLSKCLIIHNSNVEILKANFNFDEFPLFAKRWRHSVH